MLGRVALRPDRDKSKSQTVTAVDSGSSQYSDTVTTVTTVTAVKTDSSDNGDSGARLCTACTACEGAEIPAFTSLVARARVTRGSGGDGVGMGRGAWHFFEGVRVGLGRRVVGSARGEARAVARRLEARVDLCGRTLSGLGFQWLLHLARRAGACRKRVGRRWCRHGARRVSLFEGARVGSGRRVAGSARGEARAVARRLEARVDPSWVAR